MIAAAALAGASACDGTLWVVNGLDGAVTVTVAGKSPFRLEPGARRSLGVREGPCSVAAETVDGKRRETDQVEVPRSGAAVYNVAGAAPLYVLTAYYSSVPGSGGRADHENLCGARTFQRDVNYYFADPPESVTSSAGETNVVRSALLQGQEGWKGCLLMLQAEGKDRAAAEMLPAVRAMESSDTPVFAEARLRWILGEDEKALELFKALIATSNSRDAHLYYLRYGEILGQREALLREYQRPSDRLPDAERRFLAARLLPAAEAVKEYRAMLGENPKDDELRLGLAWSLDGAGRYAEALAALEPLGDGARLSPDDRFRWLHRRVWSLAALGRVEEAVQAIRAGPVGKDAEDFRFILIQGLLAAKLGRPDLEPEQKVVEAGEPNEQEWRRVSYDGVVHPERLDRAWRDRLKHMQSLGPILAMAATDPRLALGALHRVTSYEVELLPESLAIVLWAEACRAGDSTAEPLLRHALLGAAMDFTGVCAYVKEGRPVMEMSQAWEDRAAIHLARSRALWARGDSIHAAAEEALVRKYDVYEGPASHALESWPSVAPGAPPRTAGDVRLASAQVDAPARGPGRTQPVTLPPPREHKLVRVEGVRLEPEP
ncbi:MAG TPA: tetratricopeptide repeat protein [Myxococcaceae bacterium]|nr:tetratricopeptide repeat protein [Myxococcaceae bacterium]